MTQGSAPVGERRALDLFSGACEKPIRVQLSRKKGWRMPPNTVKVDRTTRWGNPFPVDLCGRDLAIELFRDAMGGFFSPGKLDALSEDDFRLVYGAKVNWHRRLECGAELVSAARHELRGKNLACWCPLDQPCHADVLLELANLETLPALRTDAALAAVMGEVG